MSNNYVELIRQANVYEVAIKSPLEPAPRLSKRLQNHTLFKREDLQPVFSFKLRGASNKIASLTHEEATRGVICASAGNHAQGVALAAGRRGIRARVVMPRTTPQIKIDAVRALGGEIELVGDDYDAANQHAQNVATEAGLTFIHPFDDVHVIAGQGTIAMEILEQNPGKIDAIFVPIGGGGLIAGIASYVKVIRPEIKIIGVEPEDAASMHDSLAAGERITLDRVGIFADGVAVKRVGEEPFRIARKYVDEVILVTTDEICAAIQDIFEDTRSIVEPAGALAVAGLKKWVAREGAIGKTVVTLNCGANMNFDRLRHVAERADLGQQREALFAVEIPEKPGSFLSFCETVGTRSITEFNYRFANANKAHMFVGVALSGGAAEKDIVETEMRQAGFPVIDMSTNEVAKLHVRYMVGGVAQGIQDERLFRFEFPERPGALLRFLQAVGSRWNISLFHYRNHGSDYGRVLAGIQVPQATEADFLMHLKELKFYFVEETNNPAYTSFLGG
jgi:threonine dehydratase